MSMVSERGGSHHCHSKQGKTRSLQTERPWPRFGVSMHKHTLATFDCPPKFTPFKLFGPKKTKSCARPSS
eukprot:5402813-Amphidinium_carterae.1